MSSESAKRNICLREARSIQAATALRVSVFDAQIAAAIRAGTPALEDGSLILSYKINQAQHWRLARGAALGFFTDHPVIVRCG